MQGYGKIILCDTIIQYCVCVREGAGEGRHSDSQIEEEEIKL